MKSHEMVERYLAAWNLTDAAERRVALAQLCTDDCRYTDPLADVRGPDGLDRVIAGAQQQLPQFCFTLVGAVDAHHEQARFTWQAAPKGSNDPVVVGTDVMLFENGRIRSVLGFLDKQPG